ncbi:MAG: LamG domain-containing protein, partial [Patescibacteria group bacterium]
MKKLLVIFAILFAPLTGGVHLSVDSFLSFSVQRASAAAYDPYFSNVVLLMHMDGTNGGTVFGDVKGHTVTTNGAAQLSTAQSKFGGSSASFDGSTGYLTIPDSNDWYFGTGDFTIEYWVRFSVFSAGLVYSNVGQGPDSGNYWSMVPFESGANDGWQFTVVTGGSILVNYYTPYSSIATDTWYHVAIVRNGTNFKTYINGVETHAQTVSATLGDYAAPLVIGARSFDYANKLNGYLDDIRITKGVARYTANFTPPTAPFPDTGRAVAPTYAKYKTLGGKFNFKGGYFKWRAPLGALDSYLNKVVLAMHMDGLNGAPWDDSSGLGHFFTVYAGVPIVSTAQSKFSGGSLYIPTTDGITTATTPSDFEFGTGDFTVEAWIYPTSLATAGSGFIGHASTSANFSFEFDTDPTTPTKLRFRGANGNAVASSTNV